MQSGNTNVGDSHLTVESLQACSSCRKSKKACDKALPECSTCVRLRRACQYERSTLLPPISDLYESLQQRLVHLENEVKQHQQSCIARVASQSTSHTSSSKSSTGHNHSLLPSSSLSVLSSIFFLDVHVFRRRGVKAPKPFVPIPDLILGAIGNDIEIRTTVGSYFFSIHPWMAFVSQKALYRDLEVSPHTLDPDVALLVLCMKLINTAPPERPADPRTSLYAMTKKFQAVVESGGIGSMRLLQSAILVALYEASHGIYPAAYLSIGHCARLCHAIGLHDTSGVLQMIKEPETWEGMEERRRIWWAVFVLDRNTNLGNLSRPLACIDTLYSDYLPVNDGSWDRGEMASSEPLFVSSSTSIPAARFARLCQASHLLSLVLRHINDCVGNIDFRLEEAQQLHHAILALISHLLKEVSNEPTKICASLAICYSALMALYESCASVVSQDSQSLTAAGKLQKLGATGLDHLIPDIVAYAGHIQTVMPYNIDRAPSLIANCLYRAAVRLSTSIDESTDGASMRAYNLIKESLNKLDARWKIAGEYLEILEEQIKSFSPATQQELELL